MRAVVPKSYISSRSVTRWGQATAVEYVHHDYEVWNVEVNRGEVPSLQGLAMIRQSFNKQLSLVNSSLGR
jgi:hypothetical protein